MKRGNSILTSLVPVLTTLALVYGCKTDEQLMQIEGNDAVAEISRDIKIDLDEVAVSLPDLAVSDTEILDADVVETVKSVSYLDKKSEQIKVAAQDIEIAKEAILQKYQMDFSDSSFYLALVIKESSLDNNAVSSSGANGYFQMKQVALDDVRQIFPEFGFSELDILGSSVNARINNAVAGILFYEICKNKYAKLLAPGFSEDDLNKMIALIYKLGNGNITRIYNALSSPLTYPEFANLLSEVLVKKFPAKYRLVNKSIVDEIYGIEYLSYLEVDGSQHGLSVKIGGKDFDAGLIPQSLRYAELISSLAKALRERKGVLDSVDVTVPPDFDIVADGNWLWGITSKLLDKCQNIYNIGVLRDKDKTRSELIAELMKIIVKYNVEIGLNPVFLTIRSDGLPDLARGDKVFLPNEKFIRDNLGDQYVNKGVLVATGAFETISNTNSISNIADNFLSGFERGKGKSKKYKYPVFDQWKDELGADGLRKNIIKAIVDFNKSVVFNPDFADVSLGSVNPVLKNGNKVYLPEKQAFLQYLAKVQGKYFEMPAGYVRYVGDNAEELGKTGREILEFTGDDVQFLNPVLNGIEITSHRQCVGSKRNLKASDVSGIVLHSTAHDKKVKAKPINGRQFMYNNPKIHIMITTSGDIIRIIDDDIGHNHAGVGKTNKYGAIWNGDPNITYSFLGIEVETYGADGYWTDAQYEAVKKLVAYWSEKYQIPKENILTHNMIASNKYGRGRKSDPHGLIWEKISLPNNFAMLDLDVAICNVEGNVAAVKENRKDVSGLEAAQDICDGKR